MLYPDVFGKNIFDDFFDFPFYSAQRSDRSHALMKSDVKENEHGYELTVELPGVSRENVSAELDKGYLTIRTTVSSQDDKKNENGKYIRHERYSGSYSRCFYVGESVTEEDIKAKLENGVLRLDIPKKEEHRNIPERKFIAIESSDGQA